MSGYLSTQFSADLDRLGFKPTRKIKPEQLDLLEAALKEVAEGDAPVVLDVAARLYIRIMSERGQGNPRRAPDFEEVVQGSTWLPDPMPLFDDLDASAPGGIPPYIRAPAAAAPEAEEPRGGSGAGAAPADPRS